MSSTLERMAAQIERLERRIAYLESLDNAAGTSAAHASTHIDGGSDEVALPKHQLIATLEGTLIADIFPLKFRNLTGLTRTITKVNLEVSTAPTGAAIIVDVHKDGTTIFTNQAHRPQIAAAATTGNTTDIDVPAWATDGYLEVYLDQVGSTVAGANLVVTILYEV